MITGSGSFLVLQGNTGLFIPACSKFRLKNIKIREGEKHHAFASAAPDSLISGGNRRHSAAENRSGVTDARSKKGEDHQ